MSNDKPLPRQLRKLQLMFLTEEVVSVKDIYETLFERTCLRPRREAQQRVGWTISRFNRRSPHKIVPGPEKYTYTLAKD